MTGFKKKRFKSSLFYARKLQFAGVNISQHAFLRRNQRGPFNPVFPGLYLTFREILIEISSIRTWKYCKIRRVAIGETPKGHYILAEDFSRVITFVQWDQPEFQILKSA